MNLDLGIGMNDELRRQWLWGREKTDFNYMEL